MKGITVAHQKDIVAIHCEVPSIEGWSQRFLLRADAHHDSPQCHRSLEKRHLDEALETGAGILDFGDLFDAMQGREDRRRSKRGARDEDGGEDYFDSLVGHAEEYYAPYGKNWMLLAPGNHECAVLKHSSTDLTRRLADLLRDKHGSQVLVNNFSGYVRFRFTFQGTRRESKLMWHTHGAGGAAPVTKGTIRTSRRAVYQPDADIIVSGHTHHQWAMPVGCFRVTKAGKVYPCEVLHVQTPSYKDWGDFEEENEMAPKPLGAYWLKFFIVNDTLRFDVNRAF